MVAAINNYLNLANNTNLTFISMLSIDSICNSSVVCVAPLLDNFKPLGDSLRPYTTSLVRRPRPLPYSLLFNRTHRPLRGPRTSTYKKSVQTRLLNVTRISCFRKNDLHRGKRSFNSRATQHTLFISNYQELARSRL